MPASPWPNARLMQPAVFRGRGKTLPESRGPRLRVSGGSGRPEIRADGNALDPLAGDDAEGRVRGRLDGWPLRQNCGADGAEGYGAAPRRSLRGIIPIAPLTAARSAHRNGEPRAVALRHRHERGGHSRPREPDAEGKEQDERAEAGKRALSHRSRIYADGIPVQAATDG